MNADLIGPGKVMSKRLGGIPHFMRKESHSCVYQLRTYWLNTGKPNKNVVLCIKLPTARERRNKRWKWKCLGYVSPTFTLFEEGELSEPEEVFMDSSSADMDFPLNLWCRKKYCRFNYSTITNARFWGIIALQTVGVIQTHQKNWPHFKWI